MLEATKALVENRWSGRAVQSSSQSSRLTIDLIIMIRLV